MLKKLIFIFIGLNQFLWAQTENNELKISVILPFCSKEVLADPKSKNASLSDVCREYYQGMNIALDSLGKTDIDLTVKIFDSTRDSIKFKQILQQKFVQQSNLMFGPILKEGQLLMAGWGKQFKIPHVSPFLTLTKSRISDPYLISFQPDLGNYADFLFDYLNKSGFEGINLLLVQGKDNNDKILVQRAKAIAKNYPSIKLSYAEIGNTTQIDQWYKLSGNNMVFVVSDNEYNVNSTLRHLSDTNSYRDITVFGLNKWLQFNNINASIWEQLHTTIITPFYADYNNVEVVRFAERYREKYYTEPTEYAFEGFRQMLYFAYKLKIGKGKLENFKGSEVVKIFGLNHKVGLKPDIQGLQNQRLNLIEFRNYQLRVVN